MKDKHCRLVLYKAVQSMLGFELAYVGINTENEAEDVKAVKMKAPCQE